jgi:hypothetical protein
MGRIVGGQEFGGIHFEPENVANRVCIFRAIQTMQARCRQVGDSAAIQLILHPRDQPVEHGGLRPRHFRRRHHARAQFPDDLFAYLRLVPEVCQVQLVQLQIGRLQLGVMANHTIPVEDRALRGDIGGAYGRLRWRGLGGLGGGKRDARKHSTNQDEAANRNSHLDAPSAGNVAFCVSLS